ncbi:MAG: hypothetical protein INR73_25410 [Williamsia sp.]|nr:hypothetical protein [Williamsia sp.]
MARTIITPTQSNIVLSIPEDYVGKPIEVTFLALEELEPKPAKKQWQISAALSQMIQPKHCTSRWNKAETNGTAVSNG